MSSELVRVQMALALACFFVQDVTTLAHFLRCSCCELG